MNHSIAYLVKTFVLLNLVFLICFVIDAVGNPEGENLIYKATNTYLVVIVEIVILIVSTLAALIKKR